MANQEHLNILRKGRDTWNDWRQSVTNIRPDLSGADLSGLRLGDINLRGADLRGADLRGADLSETYLSSTTIENDSLGNTDRDNDDLDDYGLDDDPDNSYLGIEVPDILFEDYILRRAEKSNFSPASADLSGADLSGANLSGASLVGADLASAFLRGANLSEVELMEVDLTGAHLTEADLTEADLSRANLSRANLSRANLSRANLSRTILVGTNLTDTTLKDCSIYGISAWDVQLDGAVQLNLTITPYDKPIITVDNLKIAQFIYLLLTNKEIREVIDTITSKVVLILGRFTPERKVVLDAIREVLRQHNYLPILFDFEKPASRDITETISTLAHLSRFVVADITDAKSIPQELKTIVPNLPSVPVQALILNSQHEYGMFEHFTRFPWVLPVYHYTDEASLLQSLQEKVITPAEQKAKELEKW